MMELLNRGTLGGLAQLVERFVRNEKVRSSNLLTSTKPVCGPRRGHLFHPHGAKYSPWHPGARSRALGDTALMLRGQPPVRLTIGGKSILLTAGAATLHRRDDRMFRVSTGLGENLPFSIFTTTETFENESEPKLYARIAPHQFLRLRATLQDSNQPPDSAARPRALPAIPAGELPVRKAVPLDPETGILPDKLPDEGTL
jgi:hypothetical protein